MTVFLYTTSKSRPEKKTMRQTVRQNSANGAYSVYELEGRGLDVMPGRVKYLELVVGI